MLRSIRITGHERTKSDNVTASVLTERSLCTQLAMARAKKQTACKIDTVVKSYAFLQFPPSVNPDREPGFLTERSTLYDCMLCTGSGYSPLNFSLKIIYVLSKASRCVALLQ